MTNPSPHPGMLWSLAEDSRPGAAVAKGEIGRDIAWAMRINGLGFLVFRLVTNDPLIGRVTMKLSIVTDEEYRGHD